MIFFLQLLFVKRIERESVKRTVHQDSPVDYGNGLFIQRPGKPFVGSGVWHQGVQSSDFVLGFPFFQCFITVGNDGAIGQSQRRSSDPFVVGSSRGIRKKPLDDRSDQGEAELGRFGITFDCFSIFAHEKSLLGMFFYIIRER